MISSRIWFNGFDYLYYDDIPFTLYLFVQVTQTSIVSKGLKMCISKFDFLISSWQVIAIGNILLKHSKQPVVPPERRRTLKMTNFLRAVPLFIKWWGWEFCLSEEKGLFCTVCIFRYIEIQYLKVLIFC